MESRHCLSSSPAEAVVPMHDDPHPQRFLSETTSSVELDKYLKVKSEELLLDDLIWEDELGADWPPNISTSPEHGETRGGKINSTDNMTEIIDTNILAEELPFRKALDNMCSTHSELDHIHSEVKPHKCKCDMRQHSLSMSEYRI
ncbi:uncharacterized protein LOC143923267 isoform X2 [Arctopsyche grandis]|uniref:uncharacterized protein LOC143923267 isoform X2 n=1 Tax=Arctopsyche grandis TaxID=121162 RepID=UPI00406D9834